MVEIEGERLDGDGARAREADTVRSLLAKTADLLDRQVDRDVRDPLLDLERATSTGRHEPDQEPVGARNATLGRIGMTREPDRFPLLPLFDAERPGRVDRPSGLAEHGAPFLGLLVLLRLDHGQRGKLQRSLLRNGPPEREENDPLRAARGFDRRDLRQLRRPVAAESWIAIESIARDDILRADGGRVFPHPAAEVEAHRAPTVLHLPGRGQIADETARAERFGLHADEGREDPGPDRRRSGAARKGRHELVGFLGDGDDEHLRAGADPIGRGRALRIAAVVARTGEDQEGEKGQDPSHRSASSIRAAAPSSATCRSQ